MTITHRGEERDLQQLYFERYKTAADNGTVYKLVADGANGIQKGEPIASFASGVGVDGDEDDVVPAEEDFHSWFFI